MSDELHRLDWAEVDSAIAGTSFAGHIHHLGTTLSTNDVARKAALAGARIGVWIADQQIAGRGRGRNLWHSPAGVGLYMTALVAPPIPMQSALSLSMRAAIAAQSGIMSVTGFQRPTQIDIRWPNDLLLARKDGPARKCGGILIDTATNPQSATRPATLRYAVIGIGINLNQTSFPLELDAIATSLRRELPQPAAPLPREPLAAAILLALDAEIRALTTDNVERTTDNLSLYSTWITGKRVRVESRDGSPSYTGTTAGLNPQGFLLVQGDDGQLHTVLSGGLREP
jgi:BirA family biotin operon repressor/biotin-[acetyl-CoA-carboxylase] ligase